MYNNIPAFLPCVPLFVRPLLPDHYNKGRNAGMLMYMYGTGVPLFKAPLNNGHPSLSNKRAPEFLQPLQITKTRAGMQVC
jgi:hypothetical protein